MKIAIFALDDIFGEWNNITCEELCILYAKFSKMYIMSRKESYTEKELEVFEEAIIDWCKDFKKIFSSLSVTGCSFPKLHSWRYHAVPAIRKYGALNGLSTEIYETLHKYYIKNPYRLSNRKEVMRQLVNAVKRKELAPTVKKVIFRKTEGFGKVLWEVSLDAIDTKTKFLKKSKDPPHPNFIDGLSQIISTLDIFLNTSSQDSESDEFYIKIYDSVHLDSGEILRTAGEYQGKEWFSNVMVTSAEDQGQYRSDEGAWYGKVLLLFKFFRGSFKEPYELALVRWYDIVTEKPELYGLSLLYYTEEYNTIPIGSINQAVYIVPRFNEENQFLLNKYMF